MEENPKERHSILNKKASIEITVSGSARETDHLNEEIDDYSSGYLVASRHERYPMCFNVRE